MDDNFLALDKLVEFGLSMAVAQQMVQTMNHTLNNMQTNGVGTAVSAAPAQTLYYAILDGGQAGPFSEQEISRLIASKQILKDTYIWKPGLSNWLLAEQLPEVLRLVALCPPPLPKI
jgi:hypothetical protein